MGLLDRYFLKVKRPQADDFAAVKENFREVERWANQLPVPAPQIFEFVGGAVPFVLAKMESFTFYTRRPNTVISVDLVADAVQGAPGYGYSSFLAYVDAAPLDATNFADAQEATVRVTCSTVYVTTVVIPGAHTLELWGRKSINAGTANYNGGRFRLWVL